jgi:hypothetical protein
LGIYGSNLYGRFGRIQPICRCSTNKSGPYCPVVRIRSPPYYSNNYVGLYSPESPTMVGRDIKNFLPRCIRKREISSFGFGSMRRSQVHSQRRVFPSRIAALTNILAVVARSSYLPRSSRRFISVIRPTSSVEHCQSHEGDRAEICGKKGSGGRNPRYFRAAEHLSVHETSVIMLLCGVFGFFFFLFLFH